MTVNLTVNLTTRSSKAGNSRGGSIGVSVELLPGSIAQLTVLPLLLQAAAEGSLTPEQTEQLLSAADQYQLPLMLDESTGQLIWPGGSMLGGVGLARATC